MNRSVPTCRFPPIHLCYTAFVKTFHKEAKKGSDCQVWSLISTNKPWFLTNLFTILLFDATKAPLPASNL